MESCSSSTKGNVRKAVWGCTSGKGLGGHGNKQEKRSHYEWVLLKSKDLNSCPHPNTSNKEHTFSSVSPGAGAWLPLKTKQETSVTTLFTMKLPPLTTSSPHRVLYTEPPKFSLTGPLSLSLLPLTSYQAWAT